MSDYKNKNWLYQKYAVENVSMYRLAKIQNISISVIRHYLKKFNIKIRNREQSINPNIKPFYRDKSWLFDQYINEGKPISEIAEICNVTDMPIFNYLKKFNIKIRSQLQSSLEWKKRQVKLGKKYFDLHWLKEKGKKLNVHEIAKICDTNPSRIKGYASCHNIKIQKREPRLTEGGRKSLSESHRGLKNPRWNNGASEYKDHAILEKIRLEVLKRDKYKCKCCNKKATETHHRDKTKENHEINNLISVCHKCHINRFHKCKKTTSKHIRKYGMTLQEMGEKFGVTSSTINYWIKFPQKEAWLRKELENVPQIKKK